MCSSGFSHFIQSWLIFTQQFSFPIMQLRLTQECEGYHMLPLRRMKQHATSFQTVCAVLWGSITHKELFTCFLHIWSHKDPWFASVTVMAVPPTQIGTVNFILLDWLFFSLDWFTGNTCKCLAMLDKAPYKFNISL